MANTTTTTFLNLVLPVPTVQLGPQWATEINTAFETIDTHDHSSGKGVQVPTAGLNINEDLEFNENAALNINHASFENRLALPSGSTFSNAISVFSGNLYFTNASGVAVPITDGGALVSSPGSVQTFELQEVTTDLVISPASTFVYLAIDTSSPRAITLPLANSVSAGRIYILKDTTGNSNTNNITISTAGADTLQGAASQIIGSNYGSWTLVTNGVDEWYIS